MVLKQPAGGSREAEAAFAADLHPHLDHVPADTGEAALRAAHLTVLDESPADGPQAEDRTMATDCASDARSTNDPTSRRPQRTVGRDQKRGEADA